MRSQNKTHKVINYKYINCLTGLSAHHTVSKHVLAHSVCIGKTMMVKLKRVHSQEKNIQHFLQDDFAT